MSDLGVKSVLFNDLSKLQQNRVESHKNSRPLFDFFKNIKSIGNFINSKKPNEINKSANKNEFDSIKKEAVNIRGVSITLHPKGIGKGYAKYQEFSKEKINMNGRDNISITGYISNFRKTGQEAIQVHGTKEGKASLFSHHTTDRKTFSAEELIDYLHARFSLDLRKSDEPLHMMACFGVNSGLYQDMANSLNRTVIGYGDGNAISTNWNLSAHFTQEKSIINSVVGDVEKDNGDKLSFYKASVHTYTPNLIKE